LVVLARLRRRWSLSGREDLGSSLPPVELARRDSGVFEKLKRLFFTTPEVGKETKANGCHRGDRTLNQSGLCMTGRVRSVFSVCAYFSLMIGREARPVTVDQTRPVVQGAYWTLTRCWHCHVRSFLQRVRSLCCCALLRLD
jgi:hypothetical protein